MMAFSYGIAQFDADFADYSWPVNLTIRDRFNNKVLYTNGPLSRFRRSFAGRTCGKDCPGPRTPTIPRGATDFRPMSVSDL